MKIIKHSIYMILVMMLSSLILNYDVSADSNDVNVMIPSFDVTINERAIDSREMEYPLIVYKDITYFPLTWKLCSELGLVSGYKDEDGLYVVNYSSYYRETYDVLDEGGYQREGVHYTASIPTYPVHINGKKIENDREEYPLLNFRGITYFPLTWRFVVEEFGWDMLWSDSSGFKLSTLGMLANRVPGTNYEIVDFYTLENYRDFSLISKSTEERTVAQADEFGGYSDNYIGETHEYFKLDFATNILIPAASGDTGDEPYNNGRVSGHMVNDLFESHNSILYYDGNVLLDLSEEAGEDEKIDYIHATKYGVNGMELFTLTVYFTGNGVSVPAPYTPCSYYAFVDSGNGIMEQVKSWPSNQIPSEVFPYKREGIYLCSKGMKFGSARYGNGRGWISVIHSDMSVTSLNDRFPDWNSINSLGMDDLGNLYLKNTWCPDTNFPDLLNGNISSVNDGYFYLDLAGELTKIYPFVEANQVNVTPTGDIYIDAAWTDGILHLQTGTWIIPE